MPRCRLTLSANAGVSMELDDFRLWVDVAHDEPVPGLSPVTPAMWAQILSDDRFAAPDVIYYTHDHPDHFSAAMTGQALSRWPETVLAMPGQRFEKQLVLAGEEASLVCRGARLSFHYLPHLGRHTNKIPHYGCLVEHHGMRVLFMGDSVAAGHALKALLGDRPVDIAVLPFPWLTTQGGRAAIERFIRPKYVAAVHLPFEEDDREHCRDSARKALSLLSTDTRLFLRPFQSESFFVETYAADNRRDI